MGIVIYYKSRPRLGATSAQVLDLLVPSQQHQKLFMPYPVWNAQSFPKTDYPNDLATASNRSLQGAKNPQQSGVTNLIQRVNQSGSDNRWAIIPRLGEGLCWIAPIAGEYSVWSKSSPWFSGFSSDLTYQDLSDVAQGWNTGVWKPVPFSYFPRWFGKQLLSRISYGSIHPLANYPNHSNYSLPETIVASAYGGSHTSHLPVLAPEGTAPEPATILARLVERLSPTLFELLCVELLQLDSVTGKYSWMHVAGAGDGGADGIGFCGTTGQPLMVLQAKWQINPSTLIPQNATHLTYLVGTPPPAIKLPGTVVATWGPTDIASAVVMHWSGLSDYFRRSLS